MKRKIAKRKAALAIRQIIAGAKELAAIESEMLNEAGREAQNVANTKGKDGGGKDDQ